MAHNTHNILATLLFASTLVSTACTPDADGDGYDAVEDCDDTNASVHQLQNSVTKSITTVTDVSMSPPKTRTHIMRTKTEMALATQALRYMDASPPTGRSPTTQTAMIQTH